MAMYAIEQRTPGQGWRELPGERYGQMSVALAQKDILERRNPGRAHRVVRVDSRQDTHAEQRYTYRQVADMAGVSEEAVKRAITGDSR